MIAKKRQKNHYFQPEILPIPEHRRLGRILYDEPHFRYDHEKQAARILARFGYTITFLKPLELFNASTPDFLWQGKRWELKSLFKSSNARIKENLREALGQSTYIALDVSNCQRSVQQTAKDVFNYFKGRGHSWSNKTVLIFNKDVYCVIDKSVLQ